jgi:prephenate dehydratase
MVISNLNNNLVVGVMTQALAQCEHTLSKLEGCVREAVDDTAGAAQVY